MFKLFTLFSIMHSAHAFLPTVISNSIIPAITNLETIISAKAVISSVTVNLRNEITVERMIFQMVDFNMNKQNIYIFTSMFIIAAYGQWKYYDGLTTSKTRLDKYRQIDTYSRMEKMTKELLIFIAFLLIKDVQPVG